MISSTLYHQFPTISYNGQTVTDLTIRLKFQEMVKSNLVVFYPYTVSEGERADTIAYRYYRDASYAWLIYLANDIFNPLEDWHKTNEQLERLMVSKYGSVAAAQQKVLYYKVDWQGDESMLTVSGYNALPGNLKKYWTPVFNGSNQVTNFQRKEVDWTIDTNKVVELSVTGNTSPIAIGDIVYQRPGGMRTAQAEVCAKDADGTLRVKHVVGEFSMSNTISVFANEVSYGVCTRAVTAASAFLDVPIPGLAQSMKANEENYWAPVTAYEYETELNESKKHIQLMDPSHIVTVEQNIRALVAQ